MKKMIVIMVVCACSTGCAGMEAFSDALSGLVTTGKSAPNMRDSYWDTRETAIKTRAFKVIKGGKEYNVGGEK